MSSRRRDEGRGMDKERCCGRNGDGDGRFQKSLKKREERESKNWWWWRKDLS